MAYAECRECCSASSGSIRGVERWADDHEAEYPNHRVNVTEDEDD
jgi:hypothetical protein